MTTFTFTDKKILESNSADDYAMIKEGKKYKAHGYWFRLPFMSWFPKIYKYKEVVDVW